MNNSRSGRTPRGPGRFIRPLDPLRDFFLEVVKMEERRVTPGDLQEEIFECIARLTFMGRCAKGIEESENNPDMDLTGFTFLCGDVIDKLEDVSNILGDWPNPGEQEDSEMETYLQMFDVNHREPVRKFIEILNKK